MLIEEIEKRVEKLEQEFAAMKRSLNPSAPRQDWRSTFGMFAEDNEFDEILRLGREYRESEAPEEITDAGA